MLVTTLNTASTISSSKNQPCQWSNPNSTNKGISISGQHKRTPQDPEGIQDDKFPLLADNVSVITDKSPDPPGVTSS